VTAAGDPFQLPEGIKDLPQGTAVLLRQSLATANGPRDSFGLVLRLDGPTARHLAATPCTLSVHLLTFPSDIPGGPLLLFHFLWDTPSTRFFFCAAPEAPEERAFLEALRASGEPLLLFLVGPADAHATLFACDGFLGILAAAIAWSGTPRANPKSLTLRDPRLRHLLRRFARSAAALDWVRDVALLPLAEVDPATAERLAAEPMTPALLALVQRSTRH